MGYIAPAILAKCKLRFSAALNDFDEVLRQMTIAHGHSLIISEPAACNGIDEPGAEQAVDLGILHVHQQRDIVPCIG